MLPEHLGSLASSSQKTDRERPSLAGWAPKAPHLEPFPNPHLSPEGKRQRSRKRAKGEGLD